MKRIIHTITAILPLLIISGLLYAGFFIKPQPVGVAVERPTFERGDQFYGVTLAGDGVVWLAGSEGKILRSDDAGISWRKQAIPKAVTLQDIQAWDSQRAVAVGNDGIIVVTIDGGNTWTDAKAERSDIANKLLRVRTSSNGEGWAVGEGGSVLRSSNYGMSWQRLPGSEDTAWNDISVRGNQVMVVGEFGKARLSSDHGKSWQELTMSVKSSLMSVSFKDDKHGVVVGLNGVALISNDGGLSWRVTESATQEHLYSVIWDGERWLATGAKGIVIAGDPVAGVAKAGRLNAEDRNWYTAIGKKAGQYFLAGSQYVKTDKLPL